MPLKYEPTCGEPMADGFRVTGKFTWVNEPINDGRVYIPIQPDQYNELIDRLTRIEAKLNEQDAYHTGALLIRDGDATIRPYLELMIVNTLSDDSTTREWANDFIRQYAELLQQQREARNGS